MKKRLLGLFFAWCAGWCVLLAAGCLRADEKSKVREPAVAGAFYPGQAEVLSKLVDQLIAQAVVPANPGRLVALVAPHAGYEYSGAVAAHSYALLKGQKFERVVVIAPSHYEYFPFASVYDGDAYVTPLGSVPVDKEFAAKLAKLSPLIQLSSAGHVASGDKREHSVEVELPFLQRALGSFKLVPIIMGEQNYDVERAVGVALAKTVAGTNTLIVASSDLSHYHPYDEATSLDGKTLRAIAEWDYLSMSENFGARVWEACGGGPIVSAMIAAERLGANEARVLKYANTGDVTGDHSKVVGYSAVAFLQTASHAARSEKFSLSAKEKELLLQIARKSVESAVTGKTYDPQPPAFDALLQERGAFVTLTENGELRGCIGVVTASKPLYLAVRDAAASAALHDPRFDSVAPSELSKLDYEISVLSPFHRVLDTKEIRVGRDGLLMIAREHGGLLLPQVPTEQGWDRETFLEQTCRKANLPADAWQDEDTDIFAFTALVFNDRGVGEGIMPQVPSAAQPSRPSTQPAPDSPKP